MPVKNDAIDVIASFVADACWGPVIENTRKGTIRHMRPTRDSIDRAQQAAPIRWIVFPRWRRGADLRLQQLSPVEGFAQVAANAFNYEMQGHAGFSTVRSLIDTASCHELEYSRLDDAVAALAQLADGDAR
jgi:hypothetical protein